MDRTLPPITEPVTRSELMNILMREVYSARNVLTEDSIRSMLRSVGVDYDKVAAETKSMTDAEIHQILCT